MKTFILALLGLALPFSSLAALPFGVRIQDGSSSTNAKTSHVTITGAPGFETTMNAGALVVTNAVTAGSLAVNTGATIGGNLDVSGASTALTYGSTGAATVGGTLGVTGAATLSSTLGVTGAATVGSTLGVTGATTLTGGVSTPSATIGTATVTNTATAGGLTVVTNATIGGTLGVTGTATLGVVSTATSRVGSLTVTNNASAGSLTVVTNATVGGTLGVTGNGTVGGTLGVTGSATVGSALGVTGTGTFGALSAPTATVNTLTATSSVTAASLFVGSGTPGILTATNGFSITNTLNALGWVFGTNGNVTLYTNGVAVDQWNAAGLTTFAASGTNASFAVNSTPSSNVVVRAPAATFAGIPLYTANASGDWIPAKATPGTDFATPASIAPGFTTLTDGATITGTCISTNASQNWKVTIAGNRTLAIAAGSSADGMQGILVVTQTGGGNTLAAPSGWSPSTFTLNSAASGVTAIAWFQVGSTVYHNDKSF